MGTDKEMENQNDPTKGARGTLHNTGLKTIDRNSIMM
jgi:hypothetical protein